MHLQRQRSSVALTLFSLSNNSLLQAALGAKTEMGSKEALTNSWRIGY